MSDLTEKIQKELFSMQDLQYREFQSRLMPTVEKERVIGVRTPLLRKYAVQLAKNGEAEEFIKELPHEYYEEDNLHGFLLEKIKDYEKCVKELDRFLPYVDNWATCDMMSPKTLKNHPEKLMGKIREWIQSKDTYTVRYAIGCLMKYYLEEEFQEGCLEMAANVESEEYYIRMMQAWYFATALAKQYEATVPFLQQNRLELWVHNKTIQKAVESDRISPEQKKYLRTLKRSRLMNESNEKS